ncbi:MAG: hypothetical protein H7A21_10855 [Spirochaetales bacterium]|nr:hypothetical protein [Leptospiraceae bacterium]MCP5481923.1 hypothetical protein [Spirochaetales bacterium]
MRTFLTGPGRLEVIFLCAVMLCASPGECPAENDGSEFWLASGLNQTLVPAAPARRPFSLFHIKTSAATNSVLFPEQYEFFVEARQSIKKGIRPGSQRLLERGFLSGQIQSQWVGVYAGRRGLPGPDSRFLSDQEQLSFLTGIPHGRSRDSLWFMSRLPAGEFGFFGVQSAAGPGLAWSSAHHLLAWHPGLSAGALTLKVTDLFSPDDHLHTDVVANGRTVYGYGQFTLSEPGLALSTGAERQEQWDYETPESDSPLPGRRDRSGRLDLELLLRECWRLELAGEDRGLQGRRIGTLEFRPRLMANLRAILGFRAYEARHYGANPGYERRADSAARLGLSYGHKRLGLEATWEAPRNGPRRGELGARLRYGGWQWKLGLAYAQPGPRSGFFLFLRAPDQQGGRVRFQELEAGGANALVVLRARSRFLFFYFESSRDRAGPNTFVSLQARIPLHGLGWQ